MPNLRSILLFIMLCFTTLCGSSLMGQSTKYNQFSNEFADAESIGKKWVVEFNIGQSYTSTPPTNNSMLAKASQFYLRGWAHYYLNSRWKLSYFLALFRNVEIPDIEQAKNMEIRYAIQGTYYFHKIGYAFLTRLRLEDRRIQNEKNTFEAYYRIRTQLKYSKPINGKIIRKDIYYGFGADELFFKTQAAITGKDFFDRNRLTLGLGYSITDDTQIEFAYTNEILPRASGTQIFNGYQINVAFSDLFKKFKEKKKERLPIENGN